MSDGSWRSPFRDLPYPPLRTRRRLDGSLLVLGLTGLFLLVGALIHLIETFS